MSWHACIQGRIGHLFHRAFPWGLEPLDAGFLKIDGRGLCLQLHWVYDCRQQAKTETEIGKKETEREQGLV